MSEPACSHYYGLRGKEEEEDIHSEATAAFCQPGGLCADRAAREREKGLEAKPACWPVPRPEGEREGGKEGALAVVLYTTANGWL